MAADDTHILIAYHSRLGAVKKMARLIARGVESVDHCHAMLRSVPDLDDTEEQADDIAVSNDDLEHCHGLILGSPTRFGNMSAATKRFIDGTSAQWMAGSLVGKPASAFTSSSSMHGGQESTLLSMMTPLLHHGMVICGLPYTEAALHKTTSGGTPYGASHVAGSSNNLPISAEEKSLCLALGKRMAIFAGKLK